ncbi:unnamed protein product [Psylliodes chrysocephalus]|uniref:Uncharacterized protein n=1 Tax=Psylliodes chrysocephalus TaxID=3402493 RepID=A0A9P0CYX3_9CUCU|nr:unnamed protein product [Psylliodes chrysocephala]
MLKFSVVLILSLGISSAQITSVENADGSYSIGINSLGQGKIADSVLGLLSHASGWTPTSLKHTQLDKVIAPSNDEITTPLKRSVEHLVQIFLLILKENPYIINIYSRLFSIISDYLAYVFNNSDISVNKWYMKRFGHK